MSASHASRGRSWESVLDAQHAIYEARGEALCLRTQAPLKPVGHARAGVFPCVYTGVGPPDYIVVSRGVVYLVEAKSHAGPRWPLSELQPHQAERFDAVTRQGGHGVVVLRLGATTWVLPWSRQTTALCDWWHAWHAGKSARGEASLTTEALASVGVAIRDADWLAAARGMRA